MTMPPQPLVSVVMPAYDVAPWIAEAVRSVREQTWPELELIVVDDGSTDGTRGLVEGLIPVWDRPGRRLRLITQPNAGAAAARNRGLATATGTFVALYDADDLCYPGLIAAQVAALRADPALDLVFAPYRYVDEAGRPLGVQEVSATRLGTYDILCDNVVHAPLFRAEVPGRIGGLDESLTAHIDLDFFARVTQARPASIGVVPQVLSDYRRRDGQITGDWRRMRTNWTRVFDKLTGAGLSLGPAERRRMEARLHLYWATLAYQSADHGAARRLILQALSHDPGGLLVDPLGRIRLAACAATLLPKPLHELLRRWYNGAAA